MKAILIIFSAQLIMALIRKLAIMAIIAYHDVTTNMVVMVF